MSEEDSIEAGEDEPVSDANLMCSNGCDRTLKKIQDLRDRQPGHSLNKRQLSLIAAGMKRVTTREKMQPSDLGSKSSERQDNTGSRLV